MFKEAATFWFFLPHNSSISSLPEGMGKLWRLDVEKCENLVGDWQSHVLLSGFKVELQGLVY